MASSFGIKYFRVGESKISVAYNLKAWALPLSAWYYYAGKGKMLEVSVCFLCFTLNYNNNRIPS